MSETTPEQQFTTAMIEAVRELKPIKKTRDGYAGRYKFADLADALREVTPKLAANGLVCLQPLDTDAQGNPCVVTTLLHTGGYVLRTSVPLQLTGDSQKDGSQITYMRRYALFAALGIAPEEEDDDGQAASQQPQQTPTREAPKPRRQPPPNGGGLEPGQIEAVRAAAAEKGVITSDQFDRLVAPLGVDHTNWTEKLRPEQGHMIVAAVRDTPIGPTADTDIPADTRGLENDSVKEPKEVGR